MGRARVDEVPVSHLEVADGRMLARRKTNVGNMGVVALENLLEAVRVGVDGDDGVILGCVLVPRGAPALREAGDLEGDVDVESRAADEVVEGDVAALGVVVGAPVVELVVP